MLSEEIKKCVEESKATGSFTATDNAGWALESTQVLFTAAYNEFWVLGLNQSNSVIFAIPQSLTSYILHTVNVGEREWKQKWEVEIDGKTYSVESGLVEVELRLDKKAVVGTLKFTLEDKRQVTGSFSIYS